MKLRYIKILILSSLLSIFMVATATSQGEWIDYTGNPVLEPGPSGWDVYMIADPSVLYENGVYMMWFHGHPYEGSHARIGVANSTDGVNWTKYSGNPIIASSRPWEESHVYLMSVIKDNGVYKMWYTGRSYLGAKIGFANSTDGFSWTKYVGGPVLDAGLGVSWDSKHVAEPSVIKEGSTYKMWYRGQNGTISQIGYATSPDGLNWTKYAGNPILQIGSPGALDSLGVGAPSVIKEPGEYKMWYTVNNGSITRICYATSPDGILWTKHADNPALQKSGMNVASPTVIRVNSTYKMWYSQGTGSPSVREISYAYTQADVGGLNIPIDKLELLTPYIALAIVLIAVITLSTYSWKHWQAKSATQRTENTQTT